MSDNQTTTAVEFRTIPSRPGFRFGSDSSVQTQWTMGVKPKIGSEWRTIKPSPRDTGYSWVYLGSRKTTKQVRLDEIICEAFHGERPPGTECVHKDGDRANCREENLCWGLYPCDIKDPNVEYRTITESDGHEYGSDGSVWSYWASGHDGKTDVCRRMTPTLLDSGHLQVGVMWNGERRRFGVHHLICIAFHGPCPEGLECCHNDGIPSHNWEGNLRWGTHKSNVQDQIIHGVIAHGERQGSSKLNEPMVIEARAAYKAGATTVELAEKYGVSAKAIGEAICGETWGHVPEPVPIRSSNAIDFSDPMVIAIRTFYREGVSSLKLADLLGVSVPLITKVIRGDKAIHLPGAMPTRDPHARKLTEDQELEVCRLSHEGWLLRELAEKFGVSEKTICNILARH